MRSSKAINDKLEAGRRSSSAAFNNNNNSYMKVSLILQLYLFLIVSNLVFFIFFLNKIYNCNNFFGAGRVCECIAPLAGGGVPKSAEKICCCCCCVARSRADFFFFLQSTCLIMEVSVA